MKQVVLQSAIKKVDFWFFDSKHLFLCQSLPSGDIGDNVSRHFLTNGWAECGGQGDNTLNIPGYQLNEHEIGGDKSRVRRATQV